MSAVKLTVRSIEQIRPEAKEFIVWDSELPGFGLRVTPKGTRSYLLFYRTNDHTQRKPRIGSYPAMKPEQARAIARDWLAAVSAGGDPSAERQLRRKLRGQGTVSEFFEEYKVAKRANRTISEVARLFERDVLPAIGSRRIEDVTRAEVNAILERAASRSHSVALSLRRNMSSFFGWALPRLPDGTQNPVMSAIKVSPLPARERVLSDTELAALWEVACFEDEPWRSALKLLILTGARRSEVFYADWAEFDLENRVWTIPAERSKNGKAHLIPLSPLAVSVLHNLRPSGVISSGRFDGLNWRDFDLQSAKQVVPRRKSPSGKREVLDLTPEQLTELKTLSRAGPLFPAGAQNASRAIDRIRSELSERLGRNVDHWTLHDIRRTVATGLQRLGVRLEVTEAILNHVSGSRGGVAGIYQRYDWMKEKEAALADWGSHVAALAGDKPNEENAP